jgi:dTDP-glucose 4,6-dehydratase
MIDKKILITGGSGFIGSNLLIYLNEKYKNYLLVNIDKLTYASNQDYLKSIIGDINYKFIEGDICDEKILEKIFKKYDFDTVINLAAESHVDNSIKDPLKFAKTNVMGTLNLLNVSLKHWNYNFQNKIFYHISTDEVYGTLGDNNYFDEDYKYDPRSPYSASKASSDHFVRAYFHTYSLPILISNCSNNYGPNQFHEKLIPLFIKNIIENKPLPVYGNGNNIRDWIYVKDHIKAIDMILHSNKIGETYNIGGDNEIRNIDLVNQIIQLTDDKLSRVKSSKNLISYVEDRLGHDYRYAINNQKIINELGWKPEYNFHKGLNETIDWYIKKFNT